jgi:hypothetical protein
MNERERTRVEGEELEAFLLSHIEKKKETLQLHTTINKIAPSLYCQAWAN